MKPPSLRARFRAAWALLRGRTVMVGVTVRLGKDGEISLLSPGGVYMGNTITWEVTYARH